LKSGMKFDVIVVGGGPAGATAALKCSLLGFNVMLLERAPFWSKPCGGLLTPLCQMILYKRGGAKIPSNILSNPPILNVCYIFLENMATSVINYRLLNVRRRLLDVWLREYALRRGVEVWHGAELVELVEVEPIKVLVKAGGRCRVVETKYLIGADGVYSKVRSQLFPNTNFEVAPAIQEYWAGGGNLKDYFYVFFSEKLTRAYAYLIPKDNSIIVGIWAPREDIDVMGTRIELFRKLLMEKFSFKPRFLIRREVWAVPYQCGVVEGAGNIILIGDAAGFYNTLTGEGIGYAVESALAAGESILEASIGGGEASKIYRERVKERNAFLKEMHRVATNLTDDDRRNFIEFLRRYASTSSHLDLKFM